MVWDNSAWSIEGADHSADLGRLLVDLASNNLTGIFSPLHLKVSALSVPGGQIRVAPGAAVLPCRASGKFMQQYVGSNPTEDLVSIPSTGSGSGRSDLIVARVENPISGEPWQEPDDPEIGPYVFSRRIPNVPNTTTHINQVDPAASALTLARIDIPANTSAITDAMITDLRGKEIGAPPLATTPMAAANQDFWVAKDFDRASVVEDPLPWTQQTYTIWPDVGVYSVPVPTNATEAVISFTVTAEQRPVAGQAVNKANVWGLMRVRLVGTGVDQSIDVEFDKDYYGGGTPTTVDIRVGGTMPIPAAARGKAMTFQLEAMMYNDPSTNTRGQLVIAKNSFIDGHIHFNVKPAAA